MANMLQSSQNKTTTVPSFYTDYLTDLATKGKAAAEGASYVGEQPLQTKAFETAKANAGMAQPAFQTGMGYLGCAANKNISGAAQPYLNEAQQTNTGQLAQCYMSPYINNAVQGMSNTAMRNIQQNLTPQANAAALGSGQFGSLRGSQVTGQVQANAMQDLNSQIANLMNTGYSTAMNAATQRQALLNQLGSTAATAMTQCANAKQAAGLGMGQLGTALTNANIACENALATLGGQQQTILQNAQCYNLSKIAKQAAILQGAQIPTGVKTTMCMSPLSLAAQIGTGGLAVLKQYPDLLKDIGNFFCKKFPTDVTNVTGDPGLPSDSKIDTPVPGQPNNPGVNECNIRNCCTADPLSGGGICMGDIVYARGGLIHSRKIGAMGCSSTRHRGGLPRG